jgi:hypothetical protein
LGRKQWKGYKLKERKESGTDGWTVMKRAKADVERMSGSGKKSDEGRETGKQKRGGNERGTRDRTVNDSTFSIAHDASQDEAVFRQFADVARQDVTRTEPFLVLSFLSAGTVSVIVTDTLPLLVNVDNDIKCEILDSTTKCAC